MTGYASIKGNKIVSLSYHKENDTDIEVPIEIIDKIFNGEESITEFYFDGTSIKSALLNISDTINGFKELKISPKFNLDCFHLQIHLKPDLNLIEFKLPEDLDLISSTLDIKIIFKINDDEYKIPLDVFDSNEFRLHLNIDLEKDQFFISDNVNNVTLYNDIPNIRKARYNEIIPEDKLNIEVRSNIISITTINNKLQIPKFLQGEIGFLVNKDDPLEILDVVELTDEIEYTNDSILIVDGYEIRIFKNN